MDYNESLSLINHTIDVNIEQNIKMIIFIFILLYSVVLLFLSFEWESQEIWAKILKILVMQIPSACFIAGAPLMIIFLFRGVSWEVLYSSMIVYYSYVFLVIMLCFKVGLLTYLLELIGLKKYNKMEFKNGNK